MTAQTVAYLKANEFTLTGAPGRIVPQGMVDVCDSFVPWDDPANASGLGTPAILRGTVSTYNLGGLTNGSGLSTIVRTANLTALQAAVTYAGANSKFFELDEGRLEIYGSTGLVVPYTATGFTWRGSPNSLLVQYAANAPVVVFGDVTGNGANIAYDFDIHGLWVQQGVSQTGNTSAQGIVLGPMAFSRLCNFIIDGAGSGNNPYIGLQVVGSGTFFSNRIADVTVNGAQLNLLALNNLSTGNVWQRIHLHQGSTTPVAITGPALSINGGGGAGNGSVFEQLNVEHCMTNQLIYLSGARGLTFIALHVEDFAPSGSFPVLCYSIDSSPTFIDMDILDMKVLSTNFTNIFQMFTQYYQDPLTINGLLMQWVAGSQVNAPFLLFRGAVGNALDAPCVTNVTKLEIKDFGSNPIASNINLHDQLASGDYPTQPFLTVDKYTYRPFYTEAEGAHFFPAGSFNHWGAFTKAYINYPAALGASYTVGLKKYINSGGTGQTTLRMTGDFVIVRRAAGSGTNNLAVTNHAGSTLSSNVTQGTSLLCQFNGTDWAAVT